MNGDTDCGDLALNGEPNVFFAVVGGHDRLSVGVVLMSVNTVRGPQSERQLRRHLYVSNLQADAFYFAASQAQ